MIAQRLLPNIPARICVVLQNRSFFFEPLVNRGLLIDSKHDAVWYFKEQILSLKGIDYRAMLCHSSGLSENAELKAYFSTLLYGEKGEMNET